MSGRPPPLTGAGLAVLLCALCAPPALALDVLPSESRLGDEDAVLLVRARGALTVRADPPVLVGVGADGEVAWSPRTLVPQGTWRGMEGVLDLRLTRDDASSPVDVYLEDEGDAGAWIEWPGASVAVSGATRATPGGGSPPALAALAVGAAAAAFIQRRASRRACASR